MPAAPYGIGHCNSLGTHSPPQAGQSIANSVLPCHNPGTDSMLPLQLYSSTGLNVLIGPHEILTSSTEVEHNHKTKVKW